MTVHPPTPRLVDQKPLVVRHLLKENLNMTFSHSNSLSFQPYLPIVSHLPNVTWTTWNSPDNLKIPHAFSLCWCRSTVCKVLPHLSRPVSYISHSNTIGTHILAFCVFMAKSSLMHCLVGSLRASFIPVEYLAHGTISINKHLDKFSCNSRQWARCWHTNVDKAQPQPWWISQVWWAQ